MRSHRLSMSRYALAQVCAWWARPDVEYDEPPVGDPAKIGNVTHALADVYAKSGATSIAPGDYTPRQIAEGLSIFNGPLKSWLDTWKAEDVPKATELRLRINVETGNVREVPRRGEPGYERPGPNEMTGEIDLIKNFGTWGRIEDIKTGQKRYTNEEQLRGYGVIAASFYGWSRVEVAFLYAKKTKLDLTPYVTLDADELDAEAGRMRRVLRTLPTAEPNPGEWCWRCPAKDVCTARAGRRAEAMEKDLEQSGFFDFDEAAAF